MKAATTTYTAPAAPAGAEPGAPGATSQVVGLEAMAQKLDAIEGGGGDAPPGDQVAQAPAAPPGPSNAQIVAGMVTTMRETLCIVAGLKSPRTALTDDKAEALGALWGPVLDGYGIQLGQSMGKHAPAFAAAMASLQLLGPVVSEVRAEIEARDRAPAKPATPQLQDDATTAPLPRPPAAPTATGPAFTEGTIRPAFP